MASLDHYVTVDASCNTKYTIIHGVAKRKAKKMFACWKNVIEYHGIDHKRTKPISQTSTRLRYYCLFKIIGD